MVTRVLRARAQERKGQLSPAVMPVSLPRIRLAALEGESRDLLVFFSFIFQSVVLRYDLQSAPVLAVSSDALTCPCNQHSRATEQLIC